MRDLRRAANGYDTTQRWRLHDQCRNWSRRGRGEAISSQRHAAHDKEGTYSGQSHSRWFASSATLFDPVGSFVVHLGIVQRGDTLSESASLRQEDSANEWQGRMKTKQYPGRACPQERNAKYIKTLLHKECQTNKLNIYSHVTKLQYIALN